MRVATVVLGIALSLAGGVGQASDTARGSVLTSARPAAVLADGALSVPYLAQMANTSEYVASPGVLRTRDHAFGNGAVGVMGFVPAQNPASFALPRTPSDESRHEASARFNPASIPLPATRTLEDHILTGFVALMLIAYQLRRKHRFLRPHQFST